MLFISFAACRPDILPPKPQGYFRIDTPAEHRYVVFNEPGFPYTFEYPEYAVIRRDTVYQKENGYDAEKRYWINIDFPELGAVINLTYKAITPQQPLTKLVEDAYGLSFLHHKISPNIEPHEFNTGYSSGVLYVLEGNTASKYQFLATDSGRNFVHGALYFEATPNADSLQPANDFLHKDILQLLYTLRWRQAGNTTTDPAKAQIAVKRKEE